MHTKLKIKFFSFNKNMNEIKKYKESRELGIVSVIVGQKVLESSETVKFRVIR